MVKLKSFFKILIVIILVFSLFYIAFDFMAPDVTVKYFKFKPYAVLSNSMAPIINKGDLVIGVWKDPDELSLGEVVIAKPMKDKVVIHYLANREFSDGNFYLRTKKYGVTEQQGWDTWKIPKNGYIGKAGIIIPKVGYLLLFMKSLHGILTIVVLVFLSLVIKKVWSQDEKSAT